MGLNSGFKGLNKFSSYRKFLNLFMALFIDLIYLLEVSLLLLSY